MDTDARGWLVDIAVGGFVGLIVGLIAAVNVVIYTGVEGGYEATIGEVFGENLFVGLLAAAIVIAGPVGGVLTLRTLRRKRSSDAAT